MSASAPARPASIRARLAAGDTLAGMQSFSASPVLVEAMGHAGLDFVVVDMEHCPTGLETLVELVRTCDGCGIVPLTRIPDLDAKTIGRCLDVGVAGIVLPHASPARCRAALAAAWYAPKGERGACPVVRAAGYLPPDWNEYARAANDDVLVVPLVEDAEGLAAIEEIFAIDGIDVVFLGPFDLSISLGLGGVDFRHPRMAAILADVVACARHHGKYVLTTVGATIDNDYAATLIGAGARLLSFSADVAVFMAACRRAVGVRDECVRAATSPR
ncbi:MAG: aldolase/citrate lyase family protein [Burkholderiales bacterium]